MSTADLTPHELAVWVSTESLRRCADGTIPPEQIQDTARTLAANVDVDQSSTFARPPLPPTPFARRRARPSTGSGHRILVVDDEPSITDLVAEVLTDEGHEVHCADDGEMALAKIAEAPPDLIVADIMMPNHSGLDLVAWLQVRRAPIPVVLMSAVYDDVDIPGVRFVPKPFDIDTLTAVVDRVLRDAIG